VSGALDSYRQLAAMSGSVKLAGGEGCHNYYMAQHMMDYAGLGFVQIDTGRIGGITIAKQVADYAQAKGIFYVNHNYNSYLALNASLQPFAGLPDHFICEYPVEPKPLAVELTKERLLPDEYGQIRLPEAPGLGMTPDPATIAKYRVEVEIRVKGKVLYQTPELVG
jgi:L-alanine-DL-glutamate epimerase-like enolase superfamily enzyme